MRVQANILANYASQIFVSLVGIVTVPLYIRYLGMEAYGLVGFFAMLQGWFALLDFGLTPTISRETARYRGGATGAQSYRQLYRALSIIFATVAASGGAALWLSAENVTAEWLNVQRIPHEEVVFAVQVMAVSIAIRWLGGVYRGVMVGAERLVWLSIFNILVASLRFGGVLVSMAVFGYTIKVFFAHQLATTVLEAVILRHAAHGIIPAKASLGAPLEWSIAAVRPHVKFALSITFASSVWVIVTQADKLILSGMLPLTEFGHFSLATLIAGGITMLALPITGALMPRLAVLEAQGRGDEIISLYREATRLASVIAGAAALTLVFLVEPVLYAWTGMSEHPDGLVSTVILYSIGNACLNFSSFAYCLQYAKGHVRYHVLGNLWLLLLLVPLLVTLTRKFGIVGAGLAWASVNVLYLVAWVGYTHARLAPGLNARWLLFDIVVVLVPAAIVGVALHYFAAEIQGRGDSLAYSLFSGLVVLGVCYLSTLVSRLAESTFCTSPAPSYVK
jgi:O-antigen/teichoic acid export membrane protein